MIEQNYLLYTCYKITPSDTTTDIIEKAAAISYKDFCRNASFQRPVPADNRLDLERSAEALLSERLTSLLQAADQQAFDSGHNEICTALIQLYNNSISYGFAARWVDLTLLNLAVIEALLDNSACSVSTARGYFHTPVDKYVIEAAASNRTKNIFSHGLKIQAAPTKSDSDIGFTMDWFVAGQSLSYEEWSYEEYTAFQSAVKERLADSTYKDTLDWYMQAYTEVSSRRNG